MKVPVNCWGKPAADLLQAVTQKRSQAQTTEPSACMQLVSNIRSLDGGKPGIGETYLHTEGSVLDCYVTHSRFQSPYSHCMCRACKSTWQRDCCARF